MRKINLLLVSVLGIMALARNACAVLSAEEQVKTIAQDYDAIEAQLDRSVRYTRTTNDGGVTRLEQAWLNGAGDPIKVSIDEISASGRDLIEYVGPDLNETGTRTFFLRRKETPAADSGTDVEETRQYFGTGKHGGYGELLRELRKKAHFKAGETPDTVRTPNVVVDFRKRATSGHGSEEQAGVGWELFERPVKLVDELRSAGPPASDPFSAVKGDSDKFRVIHGTASPDGRFAVALGFARASIDWNALADHYFADEPTSYNAESDEDIRNYVVDLTQKKILGETGAAWAGTRRRYNHPECVLKWSPDSAFFVQLLNNKWRSDDCVAGKITSGPKFVGAVNLLTALSPKIYAFVKRRFDREEGGSLSFYSAKLTNDGALEMEASESESSGDRKGETNFAVSVRLRLRESPQGLSIEAVNMRRLPNER